MCACKHDQVCTMTYEAMFLMDPDNYMTERDADWYLVILLGSVPPVSSEALDIRLRTISVRCWCSFFPLKCIGVKFSFDV